MYFLLISIRHKHRFCMNLHFTRYEKYAVVPSLAFYHLIFNFWLYKRSLFAAQMGVTVMRKFSNALSKSYCKKFSARSHAGKFTNSYSTGILGPENVWFHTFIYISFLSYYYIRNSKHRWNDPYSQIFGYRLSASSRRPSVCPFVCL